MKYKTSLPLGMLVLLSVLLGGAVVWWLQSGRPPDFVPRKLEPQYGYVGSTTCKSCHPEEHATWHASYHRSMTQLPTPESVVAPFNVTVSRFGWPYHFQQRGDEFWVDMVDPDWEYEVGGRYESTSDDPPRVRKRIVMVTGSHHKQTYWVTSKQRKTLLRVPWSYRIDDGRWIPLEADYLSPPDGGARGGIWEDSCIQCHAVAGQPRQQGDDFNPRVAELGIACEACHGPGGRHVQLRRRQSSTDDVPDDPIVNPAQQTALASSQICGQCHVTSVIKDFPQFLQQGFPYRPGEDLADTMHVLRYVEHPQEDWLREVARQAPGMLQNRFWRDGTIRVTGREFNGLLESACHQRGELSCLSCHSMHRYADRNDQLAAEMQSNQACLQCHQEFAQNLQQHTHHPPNSRGSLCYNCHMPHTTYGLFKAVRAHRIDSPSATTSFRTGRPNACNLCHLDQTLAWTANKLEDWYGQAQVHLPSEHRETATSLLWLLRGDAAQRAILAWHFGWEPAQQVSGKDWMAPFLCLTLDDPYTAVRNVAGRSLATLPGFADFDYDFLAPPETRSESVQRGVQLWKEQSPVPSLPAAQILLESDGRFTPTVERLRQQRDDSPVNIAE